jgi:hypothetical protein
MQGVSPSSWPGDLEQQHLNPHLELNKLVATFHSFNNVERSFVLLLVEVGELYGTLRIAEDDEIPELEPIADTGAR